MKLNNKPEKVKKEKWRSDGFKIVVFPEKNSKEFIDALVSVWEM